MAKIEVKITCQKRDMLLVNYEAPSGLKQHNRLWNGGNGVGRLKLYNKILKTNDNGEKTKFVWDLVDDMDVYNVGCEYGQYDE